MKEGEIMPDILHRVGIGWRGKKAVPPLMISKWALAISNHYGFLLTQVVDH